MDVASVELFKSISDTEIEPMIPALLEWMQDINWPIAFPIAKLLINHHRIVESYIAKVLAPELDDGIWKYNLLSYLLMNWPEPPINASLVNEIIRIASNPTEEEKREEVSLMAKELLQKYSDIRNIQ